MTEIEEPKAWEFGDHRLTVLPGISWDEWVTVWNTAERLQKSSAFYVGDALLAGQTEFGERFSQVVDPKYIHQQRGPMWVCSRIEPARRRAALSYTLHREICALDRDEQDRWLDRAEVGGWTVRELKEAMAAERRGNGGPPLEDEPAPPPVDAAPADDAPDPGSLRNDHPETESEPNTFGDAEEVTGEPLGSPLASEDPIPVQAQPPAPLPAPTEHETPAATQIRACIADLRSLAPKLSRTHVDNIVRLEDRITDALGMEPGALSLLNTEATLRLLPKGWSYAVTMTKPGEQIAVGLGPSLACAVAEAMLAAKLSDLGCG